MKKYLTFGIWNKYYLYIIAMVISMNIHGLIAGNGYHSYFIGFFIVEDHVGHSYIHKLFYYSLILIFSLLYLLYEKKINNHNIPKLENNNTNDTNADIMYYDINKINSNISDKFVFLNVLFYVLCENIGPIISQFFSYGDYWMIELIIMAYLNHKMFNIQIYRHQKLSLYLISIPFILKTITVVFMFCDENNYFKDDVINYKYNENKNLLKSLFVAHWWLFPIAMILYFIKMVIDSYIILNIKKIMDFKYVPVNKLLLLYGLFGILYISIFSSITTFISCGKKDNNIYDIYEYICKVVDKNNDNRYIENYKVYFTGKYVKDLLYTLIGAIAYNIYTFFFFQTIKYFNPVYKSFSWPLIFFIHKLILIYQINNDESIKYLNASFFLDLSSDISAIIAFLIFLEIIELNFCGLNKNLRKYITLRSKKDSNYYNIMDDILSDPSEDTSFNTLSDK